MESKQYWIFHLDETKDKWNHILQEIDKESRDIAEYMIAHETDPRPHWHFLLYSTRTDFLSFFAKLKKDFGLVEKQKKLREKNGRGGVALYTTDKRNLQNYERFITYLTKQGDYKTKGIDEDLVKELAKQSYKKHEKQQIMEEMVTFIDEANIKITLEYRESFDCVEIYSYKHNRVKDLLVQFMLTKDLTISKSILTSYFNYYLRKTKNLENSQRIEYIRKFNTF